MIERAEVNNKEVQYLYSDATTFYFMDPATFEQFELAADIVDSAADYPKEGDMSNLRCSAKELLTSSCQRTCF